MRDILKVLCESPRKAGGERIKAIKEYIVSRLIDSYEVIEKKYPFTGWELLKEPEFTFLKPINKKINCFPVVWSAATAGEISGKISPFFDTIKTFEAYPWQLHPLLDYKSDEILANLMTRPDMVWSQSLDDHRKEIPHLVLDTEACKLINTWITEKKHIEAKVSIQTKYLPDKTITNIIASSGSGSPDIFVSAHYDSMFNTVGAHDNASGVACLLKLAEHFSNNSKFLKFIFFDAEEWNKYGSYCYVDELKKQNKLRDIKLLVNIDSVGAGDHIYMLVPPELEEKIKKAVLGIKDGLNIDIDIKVKRQFQQFDSWPFMKNGVPVIQIGTRGKLDFPYYPNLHHPKDNLKSIDYKLLEKVNNFLKSFLNSLIKSY